MTQTTLDFESNAAHLERVTSRIGGAILQFCRERIASSFSTLPNKAEFHAEELRRHVDRVIGVTAPGSADRILRDLRKRRALGYKVVNRRDSLYRILWIGEDKCS
jgi:hypothetical protein